ncbi:hypothetical protein RAS2_07140 [Phycisphaerae bacterium RAS2]|nr:hypothetical protein RAS2_07140 [Phycisphaerae bacterium RAS2]
MGVIIRTWHAMARVLRHCKLVCVGRRCTEINFRVAVLGIACHRVPESDSDIDPVPSLPCPGLAFADLGQRCPKVTAEGLFGSRPVSPLCLTPLLPSSEEVVDGN